MIKVGRCLLRCLLFGGVTIFVTLDWIFSVVLRFRFGDHQVYSRILNRGARFTSWVVGVRVSFVGNRPAHGMCVSNHLSYIDIPAIGSAGPALLVSKHDVLFWPIFGQLAWMCGTLFVKREKRGDVANVGEQIEAVMKTGVPLIFFPEGTSSDGRDVLPFKSSLFQPAIEHQWPVNPIWIGYELPGGTVEKEVAYYGDMTLFPHLLNLLTHPVINAWVVFGEPIEPGKNRKALCQKAEGAVRELGRKCRETMAAQADR